MIKPIETRYKGYRFRSRLEARWAVFFDALCIPWEYEKEGFNLDGVLYLPDFWLPEHEYWVEIKPDTRMGTDDREKVSRLARETGKLVFVFGSFIGPIATTETPGGGHRTDGSALYFAPGGDFDGLMCWGKCRECGRYSIGYFGNHVTWCDSVALDLQYARGCTNLVDASETSPHLSPDLLRAYSAARSARFEHGETP